MLKKKIIAMLVILATALTATLIYSEQKVKFFNTNVFEMDFEKELAVVMQELEDLNYVIDDFSIEFQKDGTVDRMDFQLIGAYPDDFMHYWVKVNPKSNEYIIEGQRVEEWLHYGRQLPASEFFSTLSVLDIKKLMPTDECAWYFINSTAKQSKYAVEEKKTYLIRDNKLIEIINEQLPIEGYYLIAGGFRKISETKYVGVEEVDYFFKVISTAQD